MICVGVTTLPRSVTGVIDRLNARGVEARPVRRMGEILACMNENDRLLLVADAVHAAPSQYRQIASATPPALLVAPDGPATMHFERVDATARWGGLALLPYALLAEQAQIPEDWDIGSTLLRSAVQAGARRITIDPGLFERGEIALVHDSATAAAIETRLMQNIRFAGGGTGKALLFAPLTRLIGPALLKRNVPTMALLGGGILLIIAGLGLIGWGYVIAGAGSGMAGALVTSLGRFQRTIRKAGSHEHIASKIFDFIVLLFPFSLVLPDVLASTRAPVLDSFILSAALAITVLSITARRIPQLTADSSGSDALLPDGEFFLVLLVFAAIAGQPLAAIPAALLAASAILLAWLWMPSRN